jgi:starvation-inducible DNA-binding protein
LRGRVADPIEGRPTAIAGEGDTMKETHKTNGRNVEGHVAPPTIDIGISEQDRKEIAQGLSRLLADTFTLYLKTHNYHWNVTGPMFQALHQLFEEQYNELWTAVDLIAERIRALGVMAPGSHKAFAHLTSIEEDADVPTAKEMIRNLVIGQETVCRTARSMVKKVEAASDQPTMDLLSERMQVHEKAAWMLRSLLES